MNKFTGLEEILELLTQEKGTPLASALQVVMNAAMLLERQNALQASPYERTDDRTGYANGFKPKTLLTRVGALNLKVPQARGIDFYPSVIEKGQRSEQALILAMAEMYVQGTSTRKVKAVIEELCGTSVSSSTVSKAVAELDTKLEPWRNRSLATEKYVYLYLDATYEKVRRDGIVVDAAVLTAFGVTTEGTRRVLGLSVAISEAEVHWRSFFEDLAKRGLHGLKLIISDAHSGLQKARMAVFPSVPWQRCQFHLQQNAQSYVQKIEDRKEISRSIRNIFQSPNREEANRMLKLTMEEYKVKNPRLVNWMENAIPEGLTCFNFPEEHQKRIRTTNMVERNNRELKRRTKVATLFTSEKSIERLVSALLMEQDESWIGEKTYLTFKDK